MNPLDRVGAEFALSLCNPNPKAARLKDGPRYRVEFEVDAEAFEQFMGARELAGMVIEAHCVVAAANEPLQTAAGQSADRNGTVGSAVAGQAHSDLPAAESHKPSLASRIHIDGYFRSSRLWNALHERGIYSLSEHKKWIEGLPCLFSMFRNKFALLKQTSVPMKSLIDSSAWEIACQGDVCLHHVASATLPAAGQMQPENPRKVAHFFGVPLCAIGHHAGWVHAKYATREDKETLREIAVALTAHNVKERVKTYLGRESMSGISQEELDRFEEEIGLK